jgi:hypothetical protein
VTKELHALHLEAYSRDDDIFALVTKMVIGEGETEETSEAWIRLHVRTSVVFAHILHPSLARCRNLILVC